MINTFQQKGNEKKLCLTPEERRETTEITSCYQYATKPAIDANDKRTREIRSEARSHALKPSSEKPVPASDGDPELCFLSAPQQRMCSLSLPAKHRAELRVSAAWGECSVHSSACWRTFLCLPVWAWAPQEHLCACGRHRTGGIYPFAPAARS